MTQCSVAFKSLRLERAARKPATRGRLLPAGSFSAFSGQKRCAISNQNALKKADEPQEPNTHGAQAIKLIMQASLIAATLAIPFAAPQQAWARKKVPEPEPPVEVVEETEQEKLMRQAKELMSKVEVQATELLHKAEAQATNVAQSTKEATAAAVSRGAELKQQLVATYGTPAALQRTDVQVAGGVLVVLAVVIVIKSIQALFSFGTPSPAEPADSTPSSPAASAGDDSASAPPAAAAPAAAEPAAPVQEPVPALAAAATSSAADDLSPEVAKAVATQIRDLFDSDPAKFALMVEWLQSPGASRIRPQVVQELTQLASATSATDGEAGVLAAAAAAVAEAEAEAAAPSPTSSSNGVVAPNTVPLEVDPRQLATLVEWLSSPGAAPIREKLGPNVADQVTRWAAARAGMSISTLPSSAAAGESSNGVVHTEVAAEPAPTAPEAPAARAEAARAELSSPEGLAEAPEASAASTAASEDTPPATPAADTDTPTTTTAPSPASPVSEPLAASPASSEPVAASPASTAAALPADPAPPPSDSLDSLMKKKGAASPALLALGFGALLLDAISGKPVPKPAMPWEKKEGKAAAAQPAAAASESADAPSTPPALEKSPAAREPVAAAAAAGVPLVELDPVTFSFDEGASKN